MSDEPLLFVLTALGIGGTERKTVAVANALHERGWDVHLTYLDARTPLLRRIRKGVPVTHLRRKGKLSLTAIRLLHNYIADNQVRRVVCVGLYPLLYTYLARSLFVVRKKPEFVLLHNTTDHHNKKMQLQMNVYRPLMRRAAKVIFGCRAQRDLFVSRYGFNKQKSDIIYNGIDANRFEPGIVDVQSELRSIGVEKDDGDFIIGAVGTLWPNKNHIELVAALTALKDTLPNARLVIAGEGPERDRLQAAAREGGVAGRVALVGEIEDVRPLLEVADVFVLPSISETFSNATLEAMSMQKAVIVSDTGGMREMVRDGVDGFVYERANSEALAALIEQLARDPARRQSVGRLARSVVLERFTFERMVGEYQRLLR